MTRRTISSAVSLAILLVALAAAPVPTEPIAHIVSIGPVAAAAATPTAATPTASAAGGDVRSSGEGAGAAGNPGFALLAGLGVIGAGILIALATTLYVRLTRGPGTST